jgi:uncharacterized protein (UPF0332 family)
MERLLESRSIEPVEPHDRAVLGYWEKAQRALADARLAGASREGAFERAYQAAFLIATAVLHSRGYRVRGSPAGHHYVVFYALGEYGGEASARLADELNDLRSLRHEALYEAIPVTEAQDVERMIAAATKLFALGKEMISRIQPELAERLPEG